MVDPQAPVGALPADLSERSTQGAWTPGPWEVFFRTQVPVKGRTGDDVLGVGAGGVRRDRVTVIRNMWGSGEELLANACLIAAAPDLYEAGRLLDLAFSDGEFAPVPDEIIAGAFGDDMLEALQKMRAALARATGTF